MELGGLLLVDPGAGKLTDATPRSYAFTSKPRLRLPFAFFNTGANGSHRQ
jgi:hypothetical protein